jgi:hypothetical protein
MSDQKNGQNLSTPPNPKTQPHSISTLTTTTSPNYELTFLQAQPAIYKPTSNHCHHHKRPKHHQAQFFSAVGHENRLSSYKIK